MKNYYLRLFNTHTKEELVLFKTGPSVPNYYFLEKYPEGNNFFVVDCYEVA